MAQQTSADRAAMAQGAADVAAASDTTRQLKGKLAGEMNTLVSSGWQGNAATVFGRVFNDFDRQFGRVLDALDDIHENLVGSRITFEQTEADQQQTVNQLDGLLNNG